MRWLTWLAAAALFAGPALAQLRGDAFDEAEDYGVPPSAELKLDHFVGPTPLGLPGAAVISTADLAARLRYSPAGAVLLFDVIGGPGHATLPGAIWLPGAGRGESFDDAVQANLAQILQSATRGDRARSLVFFCTGPRCWLSYNAGLRAVRLGYTGVYWYRGGLAAWRASGGALAPPKVRWSYSGE